MKRRVIAVLASSLGLCAPLLIVSAPPAQACTYSSVEALTPIGDSNSTKGKARYTSGTCGHHILNLYVYVGNYFYYAGNGGYVGPGVPSTFQYSGLHMGSCSGKHTLVEYQMSNGNWYQITGPQC